MTDAICGGTISWSKWRSLPREELMGYMMCKIRFRVHKNGRYRYKILDPLSDTTEWERGSKR